MSADTGWGESPPSWALPVTVAGSLTLVRDAGLLAYIGPVYVYPTGFFFHLTISIDPNTASGQTIMLGPRTPEGSILHPRLQLRSGGKIAHSAARPAGNSAADELVLRRCASHWTAAGHADPRHTSTWWVSPLPQAGLVEFALFLRGTAELSGAAEIDAEQIAAAARRSVILWPAPGTDST
jgi:hypothetical protein